MTRRISLVATPVLAGLALVPAAWGNHQYGDAFVSTRQPDFSNYDQQTGRRIAETSPGVLPQGLATLHWEGTGRRADSMRVARDRAFDARLERQRTASALDVGEPAADTGRGFEWLQIGIGFGTGIVLAVVLFLGLRLVHIRPLAH